MPSADFCGLGRSATGIRNPHNSGKTATASQMPGMGPQAAKVRQAAGKPLWRNACSSSEAASRDHYRHREIRRIESGGTVVADLR